MKCATGHGGQQNSPLSQSVQVDVEQLHPCLTLDQFAVVDQPLYLTVAVHDFLPLGNTQTTFGGSDCRRSAVLQHELRAHGVDEATQVRLLRWASVTDEGTSDALDAWHEVARLPTWKTTGHQLGPETRSVPDVLLVDVV